jgi:TldD protein
MLKDFFTGRGIALPGRPTELRFQSNTQRAVAMIAGNLVGNTTVTTGGVSARVFDRGVYGFASAAEMTPDSVQKVLKAAADNGIFLGGRAGLGDITLPQIGAEPKHPSVTDKEILQKDIIDFVREVDAHIAEKYPKLAGRTIACQMLNMEKYLFASNGGESPAMISHSFVPRSMMYTAFTYNDKDGAPIEMYELFGGYGLFDAHFTNPASTYEKIAALYESLVKKAEGVYADAGVRTVVMGPNIAGMLAHEAIGHTVEADLVQGGSVAAHYLNKEVASSIVSMTDFAHTAMGKTTPVPVYVDDEGVIAKDAVLIENGILKNYMHNRLSANKFNHEPLGNARAFAFSDEPLIRMRNTAILPGKDKLDDMISSVDDGYYIVRTGNGQADSTSEFMFSVEEGYEIKGGKIGKAIRNTTISGVAFELLKTIDMISDDMVWDCSGMCGKKQGIPVGMGGPAVRCKVNLGGR